MKNQNAKRRWAQAHIVIGERGTGKTFFCLKQAKKLKQRLLVFTQTRDAVFEAYETVRHEDLILLNNGANKRYIIDRSALREQKTTGDGIRIVMNAINDHYRNGTLLFDDAIAVFPPTANYAAGGMLADTRHMARETFLCFHTFADVPAYLFGKFSSIILFYTPSKPSGRKWESMACYNEICKKWQELYTLVHNNPEKRHTHKVIFC